MAAPSSVALWTAVSNAVPRAVPISDKPKPRPPPAKPPRTPPRPPPTDAPAPCPNNRGNAPPIRPSLMAAPVLGPKSLVKKSASGARRSSWRSIFAAVLRSRLLSWSNPSTVGSRTERNSFKIALRASSSLVETFAGAASSLSPSSASGPCWAASVARRARSPGSL